MAQTTMTPEAIAPPADATAENEDDLVFHDIPPFPETVPIAPLLRLNLKKLIANDPEEVERLWRASCDLVRSLRHWADLGKCLLESPFVIGILLH